MLDQAQNFAPQLTRLRRQIHRQPELAFQEVRTAALVAQTLHEIGGLTIRTHVGKTGVVADLGAGNGPTIAIRADMDALPIQEQTGLEYTSANPGVMHACGHDAHTASLLGAAALLKDSFSRDGWQGNIRFLFQPAEENVDADGLSGASRMIEAGAMAGVDAVIALHVDTTRPLGTVIINEGWSSAAVDSFAAWLSGSGGHGAYPHLGTDPLWMLGPVLMALHGIIARRVDPLHPAVVSLGEVHGGTASNVIPTEVYLHGTLRSFDPAVREQLIGEVDRALSVVRPLGGDYRLEIARGYPAGQNDGRVNQWLAGVARDLLGAEAVRSEPAGLGAEDFAFMCQQAPGAMILVGAALPDGILRDHHTPVFALDERVLSIGAAILAETARRFVTGQL